METIVSPNCSLPITFLDDDDLCAVEELPPTARMLAILNDTVDYYSKDVSRRSFASTNACVWLACDGRRCAVGRFMSLDDIREYGDEYDGGVDGDALNLPALHLGLSRGFWLELQDLHDFDFNWTTDGLSEQGHDHYDAMVADIMNGVY